MLFWIMLIAFIVGIIILITTYCLEDSYQSSKKSFWNKIHSFIYYNDDILKAIGWTISVLFGIVAIIMICIIAEKNIGIDGKIEKYNKEYEALVFKIENNTFKDELGLQNKEIIDEVEAWNTDLAYKKENQDDFWIGIFIPNIYDDFEYIEYDSFKSKE